MYKPLGTYPLTFQNNLLTLEKGDTLTLFRLVHSRGKRGSIMWSTNPEYSNKPFRMLDMKLNFTNEGMTGEWTMIEENFNLCEKKMSNGIIRNYITSEFSTITFERIGN